MQSGMHIELVTDVGMQMLEQDVSMFKRLKLFKGPSGPDCQSTMPERLLCFRCIAASQQKRVLATETPDEVSSTEYCHYDTRRQQPVAPEYVPNYSTFTAEGPLGDVIRSRLCEKVKNTYADSALPGCRTPAFYPLAVDYLPKALFAMPFGSYDLDKGYGLSKSAAASGVKADLPWCPSWVQPCSTTQAPDNPQPPGNPSTPPTCECINKQDTKYELT